ncbi:hypothetical protein BSKO_10238 [Bryopsis sp. KO-2023]|nr:hypothetical protein BSKO_10238 [Bryopsis sp. KO-2023]
MASCSVLTVEAKNSSELKPLALEKLHEAGSVVLRNVVPEASIQKARTVLKPVVDSVVESFGAASDPLAGCLGDELGVVRSPFVGDGKRNVHFDPHESEAHFGMADLARESMLEDVIRAYAGEECSLSETGFSVTRPGGEGMEWHSDGVEGEMTILMSLTEISEEQGCLGVVPCSHKKYCSEKAEGGAEEAQQRVVDEGPRVWYAYRPGVPMLIDARTLHCARDNRSDRFRVLLWWIYNSEG